MGRGIPRSTTLSSRHKRGSDARYAALPFTYVPPLHQARIVIGEGGRRSDYCFAQRGRSPFRFARVPSLSGAGIGRSRRDEPSPLLMSVLASVLIPAVALLPHPRWTISPPPSTLVERHSIVKGGTSVEALWPTGG
eukprot:gene9485-biopygen3419